MNRFAHALRAVRERTGLSQQRFAAILKCYNKRYMAIERGQEAPRPEEPGIWDEKLRTSDWNISLAKAAREQNGLEAAGKGQEACQANHP